VVPELCQMNNFKGLVDSSRRRKTLLSPELCRSIRQRARLSQGEIARVLGINRASVSRWESGQRTPRGLLAENYLKLLDALLHEEASR
jgi:DNA-binding transcriptional regulator YiaG